MEKALARLLFILPIAILGSCSASHKNVRASTIHEMNGSTAKSKDTAVVAVQPYKDLITSKAISHKGLINVHQVNERYYFEIPDSLLNRDILVVNRVSKAAQGLRTSMVGYAGDYIGDNVIRFVKGPGRKILMTRLYHAIRSVDSTSSDMYRSINNSSLPTVVATFDTKAYSPEFQSSVVDMTDYLNADNDVLFFGSVAKLNYALEGYHPDKSYILSINSFPLNTEIKTIKTYSVKNALYTFELNSSLVLLPAQVMRPRFYDERVGYFRLRQPDFNFPQEARYSGVVMRWRVEPREEDVDRYRQGQLVEPKKPIVFYIDPATPKKWVPYLVKGVNAWQKAFEKAGFKNAIYAREAPTYAEDSTWSMDDARHNVIVYKASMIQNAAGPNVSDPRSGEIIESHIDWYHNIQELLRNWYFIQAAPNDTAARKLEFSDSLMGRLIQSVCTHEVGHTLGLQHNFLASSTVPVDSLRSRSYVHRNGHTPSIMDYARFNYVAQPEDRIPAEDLVPRIGVYDEWAIEWGYKWLPEFESREEQKNSLAAWATHEIESDKRLQFSPGTRNDYQVQMEDLGDNAMRAGYYGIRNLKYIMQHLQEWTFTPQNDYSGLVRMYLKVVEQYGRYIHFVKLRIYGSTLRLKQIEQTGTLLSPPDKKMQKQALQFLQDELFSNTEWLFDFKKLPPMAEVDRNTFINIFNGYMYKPIIDRILSDLMSDGMNMFTIYRETTPTGGTLTFNELLEELEKGLFKELSFHRPISEYRQVVQQTYIGLLAQKAVSCETGDFSILDGHSIMIHHLQSLDKKIALALQGYSDSSTKIHLKEIQTRLKGYLHRWKLKGPDAIIQKKGLPWQQ